MKGATLFFLFIFPGFCFSYCNLCSAEKTEDFEQIGANKLSAHRLIEASENQNLINWWSKIKSELKK